MVVKRPSKSKDRHVLPKNKLEQLLGPKSPYFTRLSKKGYNMMEEKKSFVGIDISKDRLDIAVRPGGESWSVNNDNQGIEELVQRMKELQPERIVLEATGGLEVLASNALSSENLPVVVMNPRLIRNFAKSTGRLAKTDSLDADVLAHYGEAIKPKVRQISDPEAQELKALLRRRKQIVKMIASEKSHLYSAPQWVQESLNTIDTFCYPKE